MSASEYTLFACGSVATVIAETLLLIARVRWMRPVGWVLHAALVMWSGFLLVRLWVSSGHPPLTNMYESLLTLAWCMLVAGAVSRGLFRGHLVPLTAIGMALVVIIFAPSTGGRAGAVMPALKSSWLYVHVTLCLLAYAFFALSAISACAYLIRHDRPTTAEQTAATLVALGFPLLTAGILTGAVWARQAWGSYWSWDPKETWSLITWLVYTAYLHARFARGWTGARAAWLAVAGFACVLFTYFGVSYLLTGLHSYA